MLKNEKLVHRLTLREKLKLIISDKPYRSSEVGGYSFPTFELKNNPFEGLKGIKCTNYPSQKALAMTWNKELIQRTSYFEGIENSIFTPNPFFNVSCRLDRNYISDDPFVLSSFGKAYISGLNKSLSYTCVESGDHVGNDIIDKEMVDFPLNSILEENKINMILVSSVDEMQNLEDEYSTGKVYIGKTSSSKEVAKFINRGIYLTFYGGDYESCLDKLEVACKNGSMLAAQLKNGAIDQTDFDNAIFAGDAISEEALQVACDKYIELLLEMERKKRKSINDNKFIDDKNERPYDYNKHNDRALDAAKQAIVLLKNEQAILPIKSTTKVAVIGDAFSNKEYYKELFDHESTIFKTPVDQINDYLEIDYVGFAHGYSKDKPTDENLITSMVNLTGEADVVLYFMCVTPKNNEIPVEQLEALDKLAELNRPIVAILIADKYVDISFRDKVQALILCPNIGQNISKVILDTVSGVNNPSGKLVSDYPVLTAEESISQGYPLYTDPLQPKFYPFGFGLSYSNFEYKNLQLSDKGVSFLVTNTSEQDGYVTPLVFVRKNGEHALSRELLRGFTKVEIKANHTEKIFIEFDDRTFEYYDSKKKCYGIEGGEYSITVCENATSIKLEGVIHLTKYLKRSFIYDTKEIKDNGTTKNEFEGKENKALEINLGARFFISLIVFLWLSAMVVAGWYIFIYKQYINVVSLEAILKSLQTIICAAIILACLIAFIAFNVIGSKKKKKYLKEYLGGDITLYEMIDNVKEFDCKNKIVYDVVTKEEEEVVVDSSEFDKEEEEVPQEEEKFAETDLEVEKEVVEEVVEDISDTELSLEEIEAHEREEMLKLEAQVETKNSAFSEYEDNIVFNDDSSIQIFVDRFVAFALSKGIIIEVSSARSLISSIASSRIIIINSKLREILPEFLTVLKEFLGSKSHFNEALDDWISPFNLCWKKNDIGTYIKTDFVNDLYNACRFKNSVNALFLTNVNTATANSYLKDFIANSSNPSQQHTLKLNTTQSIRIPSNVVLFIIPKDENYLDNINLDLALASSSIDIIMRKTEINAENHSEPLIISNSYLEDLVYESKKTNFIKEEMWKKIDELETEINKFEEFRIDNKVVLAFERYASIYLECGGDQNDCVDSLLAERVVPTLKRLKSFQDKENLKQLVQMFEKIFSEENIPKSKRAFNVSSSNE